eukprot:5560706-Pyramimonas_sp.AAC.1
MGSCTSASASSGALTVFEKPETRSQTKPTQGLGSLEPLDPRKGSCERESAEGWQKSPHEGMPGAQGAAAGRGGAGGFTEAKDQNPARRAAVPARMAFERGLRASTACWHQDVSVLDEAGDRAHCLRLCVSYVAYLLTHGAWAPLVTEAPRMAGVDNMGVVRLRMAQDFCEE